MPLLLEIRSNSLDRDNLNPPDPDALKAEVRYWKRITAIGVAIDGAREAEFKVILDVRGRLLRVLVDDKSKDSGIKPRQVAEALVNQMATFTLEPRSALGVPSNDATGAEWIVRDAEHVSGLLHRLREAKPFAALTNPPKPPGHKEVLSGLVAAINENIQASYAFQNTRNRPSQLGYVMPFNTFAWVALRERFMRLEDDSDLQLRFARFFDHVAQYAEAVAIVRANLEGNPTREAAERYIGQNENDLVQSGLKLMDAVGQPFKELPAHLRLR